MKREEYERKFEMASSTLDESVMIAEIIRTMDESPLYIGKKGTRNLVIVMEELSELQQEITKFLLNTGDHLSLVEEVADVLMGIEYAKIICDYEDYKIYTSDIEHKKDDNIKDNLIGILGDLSDLQKYISKYLRGKCESGMNAVIFTCLMDIKYIRKVCNITDEEIVKSCNVKLDRLKETEAVYK